MKLSIIIPALNEGSNLLPLLKSLKKLNRHQLEIILVDGGSEDDTVNICTPYVDRILISKKGRGLQMNYGAQHAAGDVFWFLHADCIVPDHADKLIYNSLYNDNHKWGRFDVKLSGSRKIFRIIEYFMNARSRISNIATGDQGIYVRSQEFKLLNGYSNIQLMEDIDLCKRLKKIGPAACLKQCIITSSRRWESHGILKTVLLMWYLRFAFFIGIPADKLAKIY